MLDRSAFAEFEKGADQYIKNGAISGVVEKLRAYLVDRTDPGEFLKALMRNDLRRALENRPNDGVWLSWSLQDILDLIEYLPMAALGPDVDDWLNRCSAVDDESVAVTTVRLITDGAPFQIVRLPSEFPLTSIDIESTKSLVRSTLVKSTENHNALHLEINHEPV